MPRQCQFPVQCSDNRRCYRTCSAGFVCILTLIAILFGYAVFSHTGTNRDIAFNTFPADGKIQSNSHSAFA